MFAWLVKPDNFEYAGMKRHPMKLMTKPKVDLKVVEPVRDSDVKRVLQVTHPRLAKNRLERFTLTWDHAALRLLADTPCRKAGIASMQLDDLDIPGRRIKVSGKFSKERWVYFGNGTAKALDRYVAAREKLRPFTFDLWVDKSENPMAKSWVSLMVKRVAERAAVKGLHTHKFRHTCITKMIDEGISQRVLEHMCGVARIPQTYLNKIGDQQAEDFYRGRSPLDRMDRGR
jgi:site-specific recombinase XerD